MREAQPGVDEDFTLATEDDLPDDDDHDLRHRLATAGEQHRMTAAIVVAAYTHNETTLDATIWAGHKLGFSDREMGKLLSMRTVSVQRRVLAFQARLHGPAPAPAVSLESVS